TVICRKTDAVVAAARRNRAVVIHVIYRDCSAALHGRAVPQSGDLLATGEGPRQHPAGNVHGPVVLDRYRGLKTCIPLIDDAVDDMTCECGAGAGRGGGLIRWG